MTTAKYYEENREGELTKSQEYYSANKVKVAERAKAKRDARSLVLLEMNDFKCNDCGEEENELGFFDFHHKEPSKKESSISRMLSSAKFERVLEEVKKCVMLCPNCHRRRHMEEGGYFYAK